MYSHGQTIEYRNPEESAVLYAVPTPSRIGKDQLCLCRKVFWSSGSILCTAFTPVSREEADQILRYPGLISIVNVPPRPMSHGNIDPNDEFLTVASDGTVIGVQHTVGYIDHHRAQYCRDCTRDFDRKHLIEAHIPHFHAESNSYLPPMTATSRRRPRRSRKSNTVVSNALERSIMPYPPPSAVSHEMFHNCPFPGDRTSPMPHSINNYAANKWNIAIPQPVSFQNNDEAPHGCLRPTNPIVISSPDELYSSHQWSWRSTGQYSSHQVGSSTEHIQLRSSLYDSRNTHLPLIPETRSVQVVSGERPSFKQDVRPQIAAMIRARLESHERESFSLKNNQECQIAPIPPTIDPSNISGIVGTQTKSRQIELPTKKAKRSRKSRPSRIQVVAPIHTCEPLDLSDVCRKKQSENVIKAQELLHVTERNIRNDLSKSPVERLKPYNIKKEVTSPGLIEPEFPPNIQRMSPIDREKALDLSKHGSTKEAGLCKISFVSDQTALSPPCLEKISDHNNMTPLDLSITHYRKQPIQACNPTNDTSSTRTTHSNVDGTMLPKIDRVFTLNPEAVNQSLSDALASFRTSQTLSNGFRISPPPTIVNQTMTIPQNVGRSAYDSTPNNNVSRTGVNLIELDTVSTVFQNSVPTTLETSASVADTETFNLKTSMLKSGLKKGIHHNSEKVPCMHTISEPNQTSLQITKNDLESTAGINVNTGTLTERSSEIDDSCKHETIVTTTSTTQSYALNATEANTIPITSTACSSILEASISPNSKPDTFITNVNTTTDNNAQSQPDIMSEVAPSTDDNATSDKASDVNTTSDNNTSDAKTMPDIISDANAMPDIMSNANATPYIMSDANATPYSMSDANGKAKVLSDTNSSSSIMANANINVNIITKSHQNRTSDVNSTLYLNIAPIAISASDTKALPNVDKSQPSELLKTNNHGNDQINNTNTKSRPKRACKSLGSEARCRRRGCIGCNLESKRVVSKSTKKSLKRKLNVEGLVRNSSKMADTEEQRKIVLKQSHERQQINESYNQPMDLSKPSNKLVKSDRYKVKSVTIHTKLQKRKNIAKRKALVALPKVDSLLVLGGKTPVLRLQKLSQKDVLDLSGSGYCYQQTEEAENKSEARPSLTLTPFSKYSLTERCVQPYVELDNCIGNSRDTISLTKIPNFQRDLLLLTSGFDD